MRAGVRRWLPLMTLAAVLGCGSSSSHDKEVDRHVEDLVTIDQGIYGQITSVNDVGNADEEYLPGFGVEVYAVPAGDVLGTAVASTESGDDRGFYEVPLAAGDWVVCTWCKRCVTITVAEGQQLRVDYSYGLAWPGWYPGTPWPPLEQ